MDPDPKKGTKERERESEEEDEEKDLLQRQYNAGPETQRADATASTTRQKHLTHAPDRRISLDQSRDLIVTKMSPLISFDKWEVEKGKTSEGIRIL